MAKVDYTGVPDATPELQAPDDLQHVEASPASFGAPVAQGLEKAGAGAMDAVTFYGKVAADDATNNYLTQRAAILYGDPNKTVIGPDGQPTPDTGYFGKRGADAMSARPEVMQQLQSLAQEGREGLQTPESRLQYESETRRYYAQTFGEVGQYADAQSRVWAGTTYDNRVAIKLSQLAQNPLDSANIIDATDGIVSALRYKAIMNGEDPASAELRGHQLAADTQVKSLLLTDGVKASEAFEANRGLLASTPDFYQLGQEVKRAKYNAIAEPATDAAVAEEMASAQKRAASGGAPEGAGAPVAAGHPSPYSIGNVRSGPSSFAQPATPVDGVNLAASNLRQGYRGLTLEQIANKWAPASDHNNPVAWAATVSRISGVQTSQVPNLDDPAVMQSLMRGIGGAEKKGADLGNFTPGVIQQGVAAAFSGVRPKLNAGGGAAGSPAGSAGAYPSVADAINANMPQIEANFRAKAAALFPNDGEQQREWVQNGMRRMDQVVDQQKRMYEVDAHVFQTAMTGPDAPTNEDQLRAKGKAVSDAWDRLQTESPMTVIAAQNRFAANAHGQADGFGTNVKDYLDRVLAPSNDPTRIANPLQLNTYVGKDKGSPLTNTGVDALSGLIAIRGNPAGEAAATQIKTFVDTMHQEMTYSDKSLGRDDPKGEERFSKYMAAVLPAIVNAQKNGTLSTVLDPNSPDYAGKLAGPFMRKPAEILHDRLSGEELKVASYGDEASQGRFLLKRAMQRGELTFDEAKRIGEESGYYTKVPPSPPWKEGVPPPVDLPPPTQ